MVTGVSLDCQPVSASPLGTPAALLQHILVPLSLGKGPSELSLALVQHQAGIPWLCRLASLQHSPFCYTDYISVDTDTVDTVVLPENIVGDERQPDHQLVTQEEPAVIPAPPAVVWRALILRRVLAAAAAVAVLLVGILVRLLTGNG